MVIKVLFFVLPWTLAAVGWIVASALLAYSHGQSDRVRNTRQDLQQQINTLDHNLDVAESVQTFVTTPGVQTLSFALTHPVDGHPILDLLMVPGELSAAVVGHGLPKLTTGQSYVVWARDTRNHVDRVGALLPSGPRGSVAAIITGKAPADQYRAIEITIETDQVAGLPTSPALFTVRVQTSAHVSPPSRKAATSARKRIG
jgi:hypothetical protein